MFLLLNCCGGYPVITENILDEDLELGYHWITFCSESWIKALRCCTLAFVRIEEAD
jgi:hypothetical protein